MLMCLHCSATVSENELIVLDLELIVLERLLYERQGGEPTLEQTACVKGRKKHWQYELA